MTNDSFGQNKFYRGSIGLVTGTNQYNGDMKNDFYRFGTTNAFTGLNYSHYISKLCDVRFGVNMGSWGYNSDVSNSFNVDVFQLHADLKLKLVEIDNPRVLPYVFIGIGTVTFSNWVVLDNKENERLTDTDGALLDRDKMKGMQGIVSAGPGLQIRLADRVFLNLEERFLFPRTDIADGVVHNQLDQMLMHTVGIGFGLFPWKDEDHDKVGDKDDKCPGTPAIAIVDAFGCPLDADRDGIADFEDQCKDLPGVVSGKGCPDEDGDTFIDVDDDCPLVFGLAQFKGCPDTDGDGIKDGEDLCPEIKGTLKNKGCADSDNDGVIDPDDKCPGTMVAVKVDNKGCALDADADGVADYLDKCPNEFGTTANEGCPEVKEEVIALFKQALTGIKFETGKDVIRSESFVILDGVVGVMNNNPSYKLNITGHTDNVGDQAKNLDLSDRRAKAVKKYLTDHAVAAERILSATGMGDQKPISDNATKEGRALNRRVEFEVAF